MRIKRLLLKNFRNFEERIFEFDRVNVIIGDNGKGKTNLLEAIYFLGNGYSPRLVKTENIVMWGKNFFYIKGEIKKREGVFDVEIGYQGRKLIKINGKKIKKKIELINKVPMVIFFPQLVEFLFSTPSRRRYFLDREVSKNSLYYYFNLIKYISLLRRRNVIIKKMEGGFEDYIDTIDREIIEVGISIVKERERFIEELNNCLSVFSQVFNIPDVRITYLPSLREKKDFERVFFEERKRDQERGYTRKGPHRDDFTFLFDNHDAKIYASQGERKLIILFTVLSLWRMMKSDNLFPILLIDEFSSELDRERIRDLSGIIERSEGQVFITSLEDIPYIKEKRLIKL